MGARLRGDREYEVAREKPRLLEQAYEEAGREESGSEHTRILTRRSLKALINQLKEEMARYEARARSAGASG